MRSSSREQPRSRAGPSARRRLSLQTNRRCPLREEGSAWGILTLSLAAPRRDLAGKDARARAGGAEPQRVSPAPPPRKGGLYRPTADLQPPPAPPIGPAPSRAAGPALLPRRPCPVQLPAPPLRPHFSSRLPPLLSACRVQSALSPTRRDEEILPRK